MTPINYNPVSVESNYQQVRHTKSNRLTIWYFLTYSIILPFTIHSETAQNLDNLGTTPSIDNMFGCVIFLEIMASQQYFWVVDASFTAELFQSPIPPHTLFILSGE